MSRRTEHARMSRTHDTDSAFASDSAPHGFDHVARGGSTPPNNTSRPPVVVPVGAPVPHSTPGFTWVLLRAEHVGAMLPATVHATPSIEPTTTAIGTSSRAGAAAAWVLLPAEAKARGFKNTLSFRRWCRRRGVLVRRDEGGRMLWVNRQDVDRAIEGLPARDEREVTVEARRGVEDFLAKMGAR